MSIPEWRSDNLQRHYDKRIQKDDHCWREILNINRQMTKYEYEQESYKAYKSGSIEYDAENSYGYKRHYRVDRRSILNIASIEKRFMITCYHKHYHGRHEKGSAIPKLENLLEFIDDLDDSLGGKIEKLFRIEPVKGNLSHKQLKKYINPKLKPIRSKCVRDE